MEAVLAFVVVAQAALLAWAGARWVRDALRAPPRQAPITPIAKLRPGQLARIRGRVSAPAPDASPLHGAPCAAWRLRIGGATADHVVTELVDEHRVVAFVVDDGSDSLVVDPATTDRLALRLLRRVGASLVAPADLVQEAVLRRFAVEPRDEWGAQRTLWLDESILAVGDEVEVRGIVAIVERDGEPVMTLLPDPADGLGITAAP